MKTIRMKIDEALLEAVDRAVERRGTTRSAFVRQALGAFIIHLPPERMLEVRSAVEFALGFDALVA